MTQESNRSRGTWVLSLEEGENVSVTLFFTVKLAGDVVARAAMLNIEQAGTLKLKTTNG